VDDGALVTKVLAGDERAATELVRRVLPAVQARVARVLVRRGSRGRNVRQEVEDLTQEVFTSFFERDGHVLRAWDVTRGLSLASFCGLVAERQVASVLRSGRRSPFTEEATEDERLNQGLTVAADAEVRALGREKLARLEGRLLESLTPRGLVLFERLVVGEEPVEEVARTMNMTHDAVYAWRSRLARLLRTLAAELDSQRAVPARDAASEEAGP
jgi:RNA polymerase sigma-70 factor (ECF subfamily)